MFHIKFSTDTVHSECSAVIHTLLINLFPFPLFLLQSVFFLPLPFGVVVVVVAVDEDTIVLLLLFVFSEKF